MNKIEIGACRPLIVDNDKRRSDFVIPMQCPLQIEQRKGQVFEGREYLVTRHTGGRKAAGVQRSGLCRVLMWFGDHR